MTDDENPQILTEEEAFIVRAYRELDESGRQAIWQFLELVFRARREAPSG